MKPINPVHDLYKGCIRWACWDFGNYHSESIFKNPSILVEAFNIFNNNLRIEEFDKPPCLFVKPARERALDYIKWKTEGGEEPTPSVDAKERSYYHLEDYRVGVCKLAKKIAFKEFESEQLKEAQSSTDWQYEGTFMETIFAVYTNNINIDEKNCITNHDFSVSRVENYLICFWGEEEYSSIMEDWETELTMYNQKVKSNNMKSDKEILKGITKLRNIKILSFGMMFGFIPIVQLYSVFFGQGYIMGFVAIYAFTWVVIINIERNLNCPLCAKKFYVDESSNWGYFNSYSFSCLNCKVKLSANNFKEIKEKIKEEDLTRV